MSARLVSTPGADPTKEARKRSLALVSGADPQLLSALAHELRNPLAPLANCLQVVEEAQRRRTECGRALALMKRQIARLTRIADELSKAARAGRDQIELHCERVALAEVLRRAAEASARHGQPRPALRLPDAALVVDADPIRLARGFTMLFGALSADASCRPVVSVRADGPRAEIRIAAERDANDAVVELFPDPPRARGLPGIVEHVVALHGGTLGAFGDGFLVRLPLSQA